MRWLRLAAPLAFLACILAANYATGHYGLIPVGLGLYATAGTFFAGATFVLRDTVQDQSGRAAVVGLIVVGALLSGLLAPPRIALASGIAFLVAELADLVVYTPLRKRGYIRAALASNFVGSVVDTIVFLLVAGFPIMAFPGQLLAKMTVTGVVVLGVIIYRALFRQSIEPENT